MGKNHCSYLFQLFWLTTVLLVERNNATSIDQIVVKQCVVCNSSSYQIVNLTDSADTITMEIPASSSFFVVQVHHHLDAMRLSYSSTMNRTNSVRGTNIGLNQINQPDKAEHIFYLYNNITDSQVLVAVTSYSDLAPMPGGCNMEFDTKTAPYQKISYTGDVITEVVQSASLGNNICDLIADNITMDFYQLILDDADPSAEAYYAAVIKMLTPEDIKKYGTKVMEPIQGPKLRRLFSNYIGFGAVYSVIAHAHGNSPSSAYVPAFSYGCDMHNGLVGCFEKVQVEMTRMSFLNILTVFLMDSVIAPLMVILNLFLYGTSIIFQESTAFVYIRWTIFILVLPLITVLLMRHKRICNVLLRCYMGHILTACVYVAMAMGQLAVVQTLWFFWFLYVCLVVFATIVPQPEKLSMYTATVYHGVLWVDYIAGSGYFGTLIYININTMRRAFSKNFNLAVVHSPTPSIIAPIVTASAVACFVGFKLVRRCILQRRNANPELQPLL